MHINKNVCVCTHTLTPRIHILYIPPIQHICLHKTHVYHISYTKQYYTHIYHSYSTHTHNQIDVIHNMNAHHTNNTHLENVAHVFINNKHYTHTHKK